MKYPKNCPKETEQNLVKVLTVFTRKSAVLKDSSSNLLEEIGKLMYGLIINEFILISKEASPKKGTFVKCKSL